MAYTQADLDQVKQAILDLATGDRVTQVTVDGRTTQWQQSSIADLRELRNEIEQQLGQGGPRPIRVIPRGRR